MGTNSTVATPIVDKNGKRTIVHKLAVQPSGARKTIPAPGTRKTSKKAATRTPLPAIPQLSMDEAERFLRGREMFMGASRDLTREDDLLHWKNGLDVISLIKHLLDTEGIDPRTMRRIIMRGPSQEDNEHSYNSLLILSHIEGSDYPLGAGEEDRAIRAVEGLAANNSSDGLPFPRITTVEELNSYSAVVRFIAGTGKGLELAKWVIVPETSGSATSAIAVKNKHLESLIKERPEDIEAIISYAMERGMHTRNKRPVDTLRSWLDETQEFKAIADGWL